MHFWRRTRRAIGAPPLGKPKGFGAISVKWRLCCFVAALIGATSAWPGLAPAQMQISDEPLVTGSDGYFYSGAPANSYRVCPAMANVSDQYKAATDWISDQAPQPPPDDLQNASQMFNTALSNNSALSNNTARQQGADGTQVSAGASGNNQSGSGNNQSGSGANNKSQGFDQALVSRGQQAFESHCTQCHDAQRSLQRSKNLDGWRATVQRMAGKDGADIPSSEWDAIATYLASLSNNSAGGGASSAGNGSSFSIGATISPLWRGGGSSNLQNPGFFPMTWVGLNWQGSGPISGRATACISCHNEVVSRVELADAVARFDFSKCLQCCCNSCDEHHLQANVEAGRFIVPFGAFYEQVNPGVYRTVTVPLIYNMGERVFPGVLPVSVLPMPYSDEGAVVNTSMAITDDVNATFNGYTVNGFQGFDGIDFLASRDYVDNNRVPGGGGRVTVGTKNLRFGASVMGGRYNPDIGAGPTNRGLDYMIYGADVTYHWGDVFRLQFEYAQRDTDLFFFSNNSTTQSHIDGCYLEGEVLLCRCWHLSFVSRYDFMAWEIPNDPASGLPTDRRNERIATFGLNWTLPGGSLLMVGDDHWFLPKPLPDIDVVGVRWATTF
jgi:mono/diheme cytochrome c family protein